jgi:hypothetical protein
MLDLQKQVQAGLAKPGMVDFKLQSSGTLFYWKEEGGVYIKA